MTNKELVLATMRRYGKLAALAVQDRAPQMSGTELNRENGYLPDFRAACEKGNMLDRPVGFVCKSTAGRVVRLLQNYDSTVYTAEPEELPVQWGFVSSTDPACAHPFLASPYNQGDCCTHEGHVWRSGQDGNLWAPGTMGAAWEDLGPVEEVQK